MNFSKWKEIVKIHKEPSDTLKKSGECHGSYRNEQTKDFWFFHSPF